MHGYVEMMERLAYNMPEGREPTDAEILAAMRDQRAAIYDNAKDRMKDSWMDAFDPKTDGPEGDV